MSRRKGIRIRRTAAVLLSAVLITGMLWDAVPMTVQAQETVGQQENAGRNGTEPAAGDTKPGEKTETATAEGTGSGEQEKPAPEGQEETGTTEGGGETEDGDGLTGQEPGGGMEEKPQEPGGTEGEQPKPGDGAGEEQPEPGDTTEEETEPGTVGGNDAKQEPVAAPQRVMRAATPAPQADNIGSGEGWVLDADGRLTISSDAGMNGWSAAAGNQYNGVSYYNLVTSVEIQSGVTSIKEAVFSQCPELTEVTISEDVTSIGNGAFSYCRKLTEITIPKSVISIGNSAFSGCNSLTRITISEGVTSIGTNAFVSCSSLTDITISKSVASIGEGAFSYCSKLTGVTMQGETPPTVGDGVFTDCGFVKNNTQGIHVPKGKVQTYKEAWTTWAAYITEGAHTHSWSSDWTTNETHHWHTCIVSDCPTTNNTEKGGYGEHTYDDDNDQECNVCGCIKTSTGEHKHNGVTFTAWTKTDSLPDTAGNYYLTENLELSDFWQVPEGKTSLCLNGKNITQEIRINSDAELNLYDCQGVGIITGEELDVSVANEGIFRMYGGKISGSAVFMRKGVLNGGSLYMYGGEISGNESIMIGSPSPGHGISGVGLFNNPGSSFTVGGHVIIKDNRNGEASDNVYLYNGQTITIDSSNPLSSPASIGIITQTKPTEGNPVNITGENDADYSQYFQSDNPDYEIVNGENNVVQLAVKHTHEADTVWQQDAEGHWHSCKNGCEEKLDYAVHTFAENKCNVCGYIKSSTGTHEHNDVTFTAWTATDSLPDAAGNYYLTQNVTLADTWEVPGETTLCLNGKTISASGTDEYRVIKIPESCTLHLYDCQNAGNITGGREGGVINFGAFHMYGGKISGNSGEVSGGGVNNQGIFRMYGGEISGNRADNYGDFGCVGGGVYMGDGTFAMYGGKISGNTASTGGGVGSVSIIGTFITIIYDEPLTIGGGAVISDNTCDGKENNVCLNDGQIITIESGSPLSGSAKIGVTTKTAPTDGSPVNITEENGADYSSFFTSDNADYKIVNGEDNVVRLAVRSQSYTVTVNGGTGGGEYAAGSAVTISANAPASGKQFDKWVVNSGSVTLASATSSTTTFTMPAEAVTVTATYKNKSGGGHSGGGSGSGNSGDSGNADGGDNNNGGGNADGGDSNNGGGNADGGNNNNGSDNGSGSSGGNGGTGAGTSKTPGAPGTGQPRVKQEKEGNIRKEVRVEGESTLDATVETPLSELADMVLTKEEKQKAEGGTDVRIVLDVKDASAVVSAADKALVEKALNGSLAKGYTLGQYLDISLYKVVGNSRNIITETNGKITVTIDVPDSLKNTDAAKTRTFAVIRVHDGKAELLADLDDNADTITIKTDRFSTYAVVYKDTASGNGDGGQSESGKPGVVRVSANSDGKNPGGGKDGEPKTGDSTPIELCATLSMIAGFAYLLLYFTDRERGMTEETKRELVSRLIAWAKRGGRCRTYLALAAIFVLLVYYHSIGKKIGVSSIQKQLTF